MKKLEELYWIITTTHELRKDRGGYVSASSLFDGAISSLKLLAGENPVLLGGFAIGYYTDPRATSDFDLTLIPDNLKQAFTKLLGAGFSSSGTNDYKGVNIHHFQKNGFKLDILEFTNKKFQQEVVSRAKPNDFSGEKISIISPEDLIVTKLLSNRPKDKIDILSLLETGGLELDLIRVKEATQDLKIFDRYSFIEDSLPDFRR